MVKRVLGTRRFGITVSTDGNVLLQVTLFFTFPDKSSSANVEESDRSAEACAAVSAGNGRNYVNLMADGLSLVTHV